MPTIRYGEPLNVLVAAKGHPYLRDPFMAIFDQIPGIACTLVEQPAVQRLMNPHAMAGFDALVLYDMPGIDFARGAAPVEPDPAFKAGLLALLDEGKGVVALHHAIAGWPAWPDYAEMLGGRFLYRPGELRGVSLPDSGYHHDVTHEVIVTDTDHPVQPLLRSSAAFTRDHFYSASQAIAGKMFSNEGWAHDDGSDLIGWTKRARNSPLVYLQPGDGPDTYADPNYRRLIENAIRWVCSDEALAWAKGS
jgi:hypothetical protein